MRRAKLSRRIDIRVSKQFKEAFAKVAESRGMRDSDLGRKALERVIAEEEAKQQQAA